MLTITFDELDATLATVHASVGAAEAHGLLAASLAAAAGYSVADWLSDLSVAAEDGAAEEARAAGSVLKTVFDETREALGGADMDFEPLLPDDDDPLEKRVAALAGWCSGFLYGVGASQPPADEEMPSDVTETLRDFGEIARAVMDTDEAPESSEASYAELVEYLRAGAQLVFESFWAHREEADRK